MLYFQVDFSEDREDDEDPFGDISEVEITEVSESASDGFDPGEVMIVSWLFCGLGLYFQSAELKGQN